MDALSALVKFQAVLMPVVKLSLAAVTAVLAVLMLLYAVSVLYGYREEGYVASKRDTWRSLILRAARAPKTAAGLPGSDRRDRSYVRELIVEMAIAGERGPGIKEVYRSCGFYSSDIKALVSLIWWKRVAAVERLEIMGFTEAEDHVLPLIHDPREEVRFSAIKMLALLGSGKLLAMVPVLFRDNSRWAYRYLINILYMVRIPSPYLSPLAVSDNRDLRKAAAVLLGRSPDTERLDILSSLAGDPVKDIRREAVGAIGREGSEKAVALLMDKASDPEPQVRSLIARIIRDIRSDRVLELLERLAGDENFDVRYQAFLSLAGKGAPGQEIIKRFSGRYPDLVKEFSVA